MTPAPQIIVRGAAVHGRVLETAHEVIPDFLISELANVIGLARNVKSATEADALIDGMIDRLQAEMRRRAA